MVSRVLALQRWGCVRPTTQADESEGAHVLQQSGVLHSFRPEVCRILGPRYLQDSEFVPSEPLLHPEVCCGQVPDLAETFTLSDANGSSRVALQGQSHGRHAEVR